MSVCRRHPSLRNGARQLQVHACDVDLLNRVLREEFVRIYSKPVLQNFLDQQRKAHPEISLPDPPQTGDLDIQQVLSSPYFFA